MAASGEAPDRVGTFEKLFLFEYEKVPVALYRCTESGLRLCCAQVQSPTVHGYFAVNTEAFTDYGEPHTLEHLIFLGSERYPYKGVLDVLANRCFAQGTNAWTATDHTCYTVDTAGSEGFLNILPVYLDHVLFPTLKDSGFVTEVHHITGEGENAGVVYCEMQARENEAGDMCDRAMRLGVYPGKCSYKAETGGRLKELRDLTNKMVTDYHRAYYRPDNLCVIVTGQLGFREFCEACAPVIQSIQQSERIKTLPALQRPFTGSVPKPGEHVDKRMEFPAEDETTGGVVEMAWHGPAWTSLEELKALEVLLAYLCQDSISPLRKALVETLPALCGKISNGLHPYSTQLINITLESCAVSELQKRNVTKEVNAVFEAAAASDGSGMDLTRLHSLIRQRQRKFLSAVESNPHDLFSGAIIEAFMYAPEFAPIGKDGEAAKRQKTEGGLSLRARLDEPTALAGLLDWPVDRWIAVCAKYLSPTNPGCTVVGFPSKACGEKLQSEDKARIAEQVKQLGEAGCKAKGEELAAAEEENDVDTPEEVAQSFKVPDASKVKLIEVSTVTAKNGKIEEVYGSSTGLLKERLEKSAKAGAAAPNFQFDYVAGAQFINCNLMLPITELTTRELELLPIWCDVAYELPMAESSLGPKMDYEAVVAALTDLTVSKSFSMGVGGGRFGAGAAGNMLHVSMKVERSQYAKAPLWLMRILADTEFSIDRLRVAGQRMLNDVPDSKRNGRVLLQMAMKAMNYGDATTHGASNVFRQERVLTELVQGGESTALEKAIEELKVLRLKLLKEPTLAFVRMAGDIPLLGDDVFAPWRQGPFQLPGGVFAPDARVCPQPALNRELFASDALRPAAGVTSGCIMSSSAEESNYWVVQCESFTDPRSPDLAALLVAVEYITALEGPMWRKIRGKGYSYGYSLSHNLENGSLKFVLTKATNPIEAYKVGVTIVQQLCAEPDADAQAAEMPEDEGDEDDGEETLDPSAIEAAQSGVIFGLIESGDTVPGAMGDAFDNTLSRTPPDQMQWLLKEVQAVTEESVRNALRTHILPLFTGSCSRLVSIMCPATKREELEKGIASLEPPFKVVHFDVDSIVSTVAPSDGYANLRAKVRAA